MTKRRILALTDAQAATVRGALRTWTENAEGYASESHLADKVFRQMDEREYTMAERGAIIRFALKLTKESSNA